MVAITRLVAKTVVGAARTIASETIFFLEEEGGGMDEDGVDATADGRGAEDVVDALPMTLETIGAAYPAGTLSRGGEVADAVAGQLLEGRCTGRVVEVAGHDDEGFADDTVEGVKGLAEPVSYLQAEGTAVALTAETAGCMDDEDVEGVATGDASGNIEDVARGTHPLD